MEDRDTAAKTPRLSQIRKLIYGDRLDILERRIEILARNLGREVAAARNELSRRFGPIEERLEELEGTREQELDLLREELRGELNSGLEREGESRNAQRAELEDQMNAHGVQVSSDLKAAIAAAVTAREGLVSRLRVEVERASKAGKTELEDLGRLLRTELVRLREEVASTQQLSRLFRDLSAKLEGLDGQGGGEES